MEAIIFIAIGAALAYFFMNSRKAAVEHRTTFEETNDLSKLVHYKRRILTTSAYSESSTYELLYFKVKELTNGLLLKHKHRLLPADGALQIESDFERYYEREDQDWRIRKTLRIEDLSDSEILVLAIHAFTGIHEHGSKVRKNRFFANRALEYLISERKSQDAAFAKGLILLFGFQEALAPQTRAAEEALSAAGAGFSVREELSAVGAFRELESIKSVHANHVSETWRSHAELSQLVQTYHPDNING